jgi:pimeloyl-ACP methyl ester carboxylesterase
MLDAQRSSPGSTSNDAQEYWTSVEGVRMRYLRAGSGPAFVLLHGLLGYSFSWRFNIAAFAKHRTVYAVDMPGAGLSERSAKLDCSVRGSARRLLNYADKLGLDSFDLLGTSHGGAVAMLATAIANETSGERVRRLILVAPANPWSAHGRELAPFAAGPLVSGLLGRCMPRLSFANGIVVRRLYGNPRRIPPGTIEGYSRPYTSKGSFDYVFKILRTWNDDLDDVERALPKIADIPTLLIWGSLDRAVLPESAKMLARRLRNCELIEFSGVGHLPYEEAPDAFNHAVVEFLSRA